MNKRLSAAFCASLALFVLLAACGKMDQPGSNTDSGDKDQKIDSTIYVGVGHCGIGSELKGLFKKCIEDAGGKMVWFEYYTKYDGQAEQLIGSVDALIVPGSSSGDTTGRTEYDKKIISEAGYRGKPVLGICFGCQKINQSRMGIVSLVTDEQCWKDSAPSEEERINHYKGSTYYVHPIKINKDSRLYKIYGTDSLFVNSSHKYCVTSAGLGLRIAAYAPDGIIEGVESIETDPMNATADYIGVQYHPERLYGAFNDTIHLRLFKYLVDEARKRKFKE